MYSEQQVLSDLGSFKIIICRFYTRGRIIRLDELSSVVRLSRRTTKDCSSRRIMRLVPVFILETHNPSNNKCLPKFVQTDNASSSIKTAILYLGCDTEERKTKPTSRQVNK